MKCLPRVFFIILILTFFSTIQLTSINLREKRRNNGFRVFMSKGYIDDISDFIMAFLKSSKIQDHVKTLAGCINDLIKTFSSLSIVTQKLNDNPNLMSFMDVISTFNQIYRDANNNLICKDSTQELRTFIDTFINDPKIGRRDPNGYFKTMLDIVNNRYARIYFELVKSSNYYKHKEFYKAGERIGDLFYNLIRLVDISDDTKDFEGYSLIVADESQASFQNDANLFKKRFSFCVNSLQKILPDIYNFYNSNVQGADIIPTINDLIKSIFETNQILQCFDGVSSIMSDLRSTNYNRNNAKREIKEKEESKESKDTPKN